MFSCSNYRTIPKIRPLLCRTSTKAVMSTSIEVEEVRHSRGVLNRHSKPAVTMWHDEYYGVQLRYYLRGIKYRPSAPHSLTIRRDVLRWEMWNNAAGKIHRFKLPATTKYNSKGIVEKERWFIEGENVGFENGPVSVEYYMTGEKYIESWLDIDAKNHQLDFNYQPSRILYHINGHKREERWCDGAGKQSKLIRYGEDGKHTYMAYFQRGVYGRMDGSEGPAVTRYHKNGRVSSEEWYCCGQHRRTDRPASIKYDFKGNKIEERWCVTTGDQISRKDGPAIIKYRPNGQILHEKFMTDGIIDRIVRYDRFGAVLS